MRRLVAASKALTSQRTPNQSDPHQRSWIFFKQLAERVRIGRLSVITVGEQDQSSFPLGLNPGEVLEARTVAPVKDQTGQPVCRQGVTVPDFAHDGDIQFVTVEL